MSCNKPINTPCGCDPCVDENPGCSCPIKDLSTDCVLYTGDDLECSGIPQNTILTDLIQQLDSFICNLVSQVSNINIDVDGTNLQLIINNTVINEIPLCPIVQTCIENNPQIICNIVDNNCGDGFIPIIDDISYTEEGCCQDEPTECAVNLEDTTNTGDIFYFNFQAPSDSQASKSIMFNTDGTRMFFMNPTNYQSSGLYPFGNAFRQVDLIIPFDITTINMASLTTFETGSSGAGNMTISLDGINVYITDEGLIKQYTLSTPFDITTISYTGNFYDAISNIDDAGDLNISDDGQYLFVRTGVGVSGDPGAAEYIRRLELSTPFDLSTAIFSGNELLAGGSLITNSYGFRISPTGDKLYWGEKQYITEYDLSIPFDLTSATNIQTQYLPSSDTLTPQSRSSDGIYINYENKEIIFIHNAQEDYVYKYTWNC